MKVFLFDESGQLITYFCSPDACGSAIGASPEAVRGAINRGNCLMARYYVARRSLFPGFLINKHDHNAALNFSTGSQFTAADELGGVITSEQLAGLKLLAVEAFTFDSYLFGGLLPKVERPESLFPPDRLLN